MRRLLILGENKTHIPDVMVSNVTLFLADILFRYLFLPAPVFNLDEGKKEDFEKIYEGLKSRVNPIRIDYTCLYPKVDFLRHLVQEKDVLLHGSNRFGMDKLQPKRQTDWNGRLMDAVFASGDGIWPMFFAIVDQQHYRGSYRNGCFVIQGEKSVEKRYYFFSLNAEFRYQNPWQDGMIYILPKETFRKTGKGVVRFDEWASQCAVKPIGRVKISPEDFPFLDKVSWHEESETIYKSWLLYKGRVRRGSGGGGRDRLGMNSKASGGKTVKTGWKRE